MAYTIRPYNPSRQDPETLKAVFSGRDPLFLLLLESIKKHALKETHQHWMLVGPRGIGKSHIIAMLQHLVRTDDIYKTNWLPVWFPEEAAGIITLRDFLEKILMLAEEELKRERNSIESEAFKKILQETSSIKDDTRVNNRMRAFLIDWRRTNARKFLILLENAARLLGGRAAKNLRDEKWLRDFMMNEDTLLVIATSPTYFAQIENENRPLYELFRVEPLSDLSFDDSMNFLMAYARNDQRHDLAERFERNRSRVEGIYTLTGGNPRLLVLLYLITRESFSNIIEIEEEFYRLLEELTPYFQSRMEMLTDQQEKILIAFADGPELLTPAEVAKRLRLSTNVVTSNLTKLETAGFIKRSKKTVKGKKGRPYKLSETIFRYWYQMGSERGQNLVELFVRFIVLFYTYREIEQMYVSLAQKKISEKADSEQKTPLDFSYIRHAMTLSKQQEIERLLDDIEKACSNKKTAGEIKLLKNNLLELHPDDGRVLTLCGIRLLESTCPEIAIDCFKEAVLCAEKSNNSKLIAESLYNFGTALSELAKIKGDESLFRESFEKYGLVVKYKGENHNAYNNWGTALYALAKIKRDESLFRESFEKFAFAIKHKKDKHESYNNWGIALSELAKIKTDESLYRESFEKYGLAVKYKEDKYEAYNNWGTALSELAEIKRDEKLYLESFEKFSLAAKYNENDNTAYNNWGITLFELAKMKGDEKLYLESFEKFSRAVKYQKDDSAAYNNWGIVLSRFAKMKGDEKLYLESFEKFSLAVKYQKDHPEPYYNWGKTLSELAELKRNDILMQEAIDKMAFAWRLIKSKEVFDHPLMVNTAVLQIILLLEVRQTEKAETVFIELLGNLTKVANMDSALPYFYSFFVALAKKGKVQIGLKFLTMLIDGPQGSSFEPISFLAPFFEYLDTKDESKLERQPPEIQKLLKKLLEEIKSKKESVE